MRRGLVATLWFISAWKVSAAGGATFPALMPLPAQISERPGKLVIDGSFAVRTSGYSDSRLKAAISRFVTHVSEQTGIPFSGGPRATVVIECAGAAPEYPTLGEDESYRIDIAADGARLSAPTVSGIRHGLQTLSQLVAVDAHSFYFPAVHIEDRPRFPWRGLMLDVSRHWMSLAVIRRNLDALAAVKFNVFHWHLSDDQGFRVESRRFPKLQQLGSDGNYYTQDEVRGIIAYARDRGIRVIPEFDVPGHTTSWLVGYPELGSAPGPYRIERSWGIFEPTLDVTREEVYTFLDGLFGEMAALFPDPYFHIGGDEVLDKQWRANPKIQAFARSHSLKDSLALHAYFNRRVQQILTRHGKKMIGWDEVLAPGLDNSVVIQSWRGQKSLRDAALKGYRGILSYGYYLDHMNSAAFHYAADPLGAEAKELAPAQAKLILGGEACMWTEYVTEDTVDSRLWPRAAAIAERLWSPADVTDAESMYDRLALVSRWLDSTGLEHRANYPRLLDRLAGGRAPHALRILADSVEAQGIDPRQDIRHYNLFVPLNRLADAARPESESIREMNQMVDRVLTAPNPAAADLAQLRSIFRRWSANDGDLQSILASDYLLTEVAPVSADLSKLGSIGMRALQFLETGEQPPADWITAQMQELGSMSHPQTEVVLAAVRPVKALIAGVSRAGSAATPEKPTSHRPQDK